MIIFTVSKLLQWLYGWSDITQETKYFLTLMGGGVSISNGQP